MKQFLWRLLRFLGVVAILFVCIFCYNTYQMRKRKPKLNAETWLVGDSQVMVGINPALLHNTVNIAQQAEPLVVTYYKLKSLLAYQQPRQIVLGFSPHHLSDFNDLKFKLPKMAKSMFDKTYPIMSPQDFSPFETDEKALWWTYFQHWCIIPKANHHSYIGQYETRPKQLQLSNPRYAVERHFYRGKEQAGISKNMLEALENIIQLTTAKQVTLILVALPVHKAYASQIPAKFITTFQTKAQELMHRKIILLDYRDFQFEDNAFSDHDHLNYEGATLFTKLLTQKILF